MSINVRMGYTATARLPSAGWGDPSSHEHSVHFYGDDRFLLEELSRFIGSALGAGDAAIVIATKAHRDGLARLLRERGLDIAPALRRGQYVSLDAADTLSRFMVGGWPDPARFAEAVGDVIANAATAATTAQATRRAPGPERSEWAQRVAAFGEMVALLWADGKLDAALRLEQLWDDLAETHSFDLRCAYPINSFYQAGDGEHIGRICAAHSSVMPAESYTALADEEARLRAVILLQQKAQALETEIEERKRVQQSLQRREAELADFLENALEGVQQVGADQIIVWANKALMDLLDYSPEEYVGHKLGEFHASDEVFQEFWSKLMRREDIYDYPVEMRCKGGSVRDVLINSNGLWEGDRFIHTRCFIRDVTEQRRMERAILERNHALNEAVASRDEFLSVAAHELKTPLTSLRGFAQLLLRAARQNREISPERLEFALDAIETQTGKLNQLVARLLDSAQIEAGKLRIEPANTDLAALVQSVLAQHREHSSHALVFDGPEHLEALVDPIRFEQVVTNLLDNAVKFSPQGSVVTVQLEQGGDGAIRLSVTDEGMGVPPDQREAIFERFHQSHSDRHLSGMGLGLYITREIIELHGGRVTVEEPEHSGSRFVVALPSSAA